MAQLNLQLPGEFNFKHPDDWPRWKRRFEQFRLASGLADGSDEKQVSTLLYCLGEETEAVLTSTNITDDEKKVYCTVMSKFDGYFRVRKNVIFEIARFNRHSQQAGESANQYITALYELAENCEYGALKSEMIRDRLVVGIRDSGLSERLQLDADLDLEKAKKSIRQREAVHEQQQSLKTAEQPSKIEALRPDKPPSRRQKSSQPYGRGRQKAASSSRQKTTPARATKHCNRCGNEPHTRDKCPAKDATCHYCKRKGHYGTVCFSKTAADSVEAALTPIDVAFLDSMTPAGKPERAWFTQIQLCDRKTLFKMDTGAEVTAVSKTTHQHLGKPKLSSPDKILYGPSRRPLKVMGQFVGRLAHKGRESLQQVFVVEGKLIGPASNHSATPCSMDASYTSPDHTEPDVCKQFPAVFKGLGNLGEEFTIQLRPDAKPHALFSPRHVALPLRPKVEQELARMESMGVISKVDSMVCGYGCRPQEKRQRPHLCRSEATKSKCLKGGAPPANRG